MAQTIFFSCRAFKTYSAAFSTEIEAYTSKYFAELLQTVVVLLYEVWAFAVKMLSFRWILILLT